jgi:hypothetical protein
MKTHEIVLVFVLLRCVIVLDGYFKVLRGLGRLPPLDSGRKVPRAGLGFQTSRRRPATSSVIRLRLSRRRLFLQTSSYYMFLEASYLESLEITETHNARLTCVIGLS